MQAPRVEEVQKEDRAAAVEALHPEEVLLGPHPRFASDQEPLVRGSPADQDLERDLLLHEALSAAPETRRAKCQGFRLGREAGGASAHRGANVDRRRGAQVAAKPVGDGRVGLVGPDVVRNRLGQVCSRETRIEGEVHGRSGRSLGREHVDAGALLRDAREGDLGLPFHAGHQPHGILHGRRPVGKLSALDDHRRIGLPPHQGHQIDLRVPPVEPCLLERRCRRVPFQRDPDRVGRAPGAGAHRAAHEKC